MTPKNLNKAVELAKAVCSIINETGVISFDPRRYGPRVQMADEEFLATFPEYEVVERGWSDYPYELRANVDGVCFMTIMTQEEYDGLVR